MRISRVTERAAGGGVVVYFEQDGQTVPFDLPDGYETQTAKSLRKAIEGVKVEKLPAPIAVTPENLAKQRIDAVNMTLSEFGDREISREDEIPYANAWLTLQRAKAFEDQEPKK